MSGTRTPPSQLALGGLNRVYDAIEGVVPAVQHTSVQQALWDTIEEFCLQSTYFRQQVVWQMAPNQNQVDLNPIDASTVAFLIIDVSGILSWAAQPLAILVDMGFISQYRTGYAWVACKPPSLTATLPPELTGRWFEAMKNGTLMRLYSHPAKPYSSPKLAEEHGRAFRTLIREARDLAQRFNTGGRQPFVFPYFATGVRKN